MKLGIDISQAVYEGTGVGRFTHGLIEAILEHDTTNSWVFLFSAFRKSLNNELLRKIKQSRHKFVRLPFSPCMLSFMWNTLHIIPVETFTGSLDVFICSDWTEPPARCKKATIVHDFAYIRYPETVDKLILDTQKKRMEWVKKESSFVITPSIATKEDVIQFLSIPSKKITPLYSGVNVIKPTTEILQDTARKFSLSKPFILSVGKIEPRKNIPRLIEGFNQVKKGNWELLIVGLQGWELESSKMTKTGVRFTGFVSEVVLHALYELSQFFILPSLWEGFGYPVIEAMSHHKAVAASNNSSLKELVEGRGILFDPLSTFDIAASLETLMNDPQVRSTYENKGYEFSKQFTWKRYYKGLMKVVTK